MEIKKIIVRLNFSEKEAILGKFSAVIKALREIYPLVVQVSPGTVTIGKPEGSILTVTSSLLGLEEVFVNKKEAGIEFIKSPIRKISKIIDIKKFSSFSLQIFGTKKAISSNLLRPVFKDIPSTIPQSIDDILRSKIYGMGVRIIFKRENSVDSVTVEPLYEKLKYNYINFVAEIPKEGDVNKSLKIIEEEYTFFKEIIDNILVGG